MSHPAARHSRRAPLWVDLSILGVVGVMLLAALAAGGATLYRQFYGPAAFVAHYLELLSEGRAADALRIPGVAIDRETLEGAGIEVTASEALLREAALAPLSDVEIVAEERGEETTAVTVSYVAGAHPGTSRFTVAQDGWVGVTPQWRFTRTPLAAIDLTVLGADRFAVNGFEMDRRQVTADPDAEAEDPIPMLVFTPGVYSITVDTPISTSPGVSLLADTPLAATPVEVQTEPTAEFVGVVQQRVEEFLTACTDQEVLQPTACPFGLQVTNRILAPPQWSIAQQPDVSVEPDGSHWRIPPTDATAHVEVDIQSLYDGSVTHVSEDVPFQVNGTIVILPDGSASIRVGSPAD